MKEFSRQMEGDKKRPPTDHHQKPTPDSKPLVKSGISGSVWGGGFFLQHPRPGGYEAHGHDISRSPVTSPVVRGMIFMTDKIKTNTT